MTLKPPIGRDDFRSDLTRWNRAGLKRFQYVDGNAAVWLEELRIGMLAQYLRGIDADNRLPEKWRDLFTKPTTEWELTHSQEAFSEAVAWADILPAAPVAPETGGARARRLIEQYERRSPDYGREIMTAFARAAHVLLGHLDAYANEGYLRTATQWDNLRKLAAMVNYLPTPPASATTTVALIVAEAGGLIEVAAGLAMKYASPEGGAPLIFETLKPVVAHRELNAARAVDWNANATPINVGAKTVWNTPEKAKLAQGDPAVLAGWDMMGTALTIVEVERDMDAGLAGLRFDPAAGIDPPLFEAGLYVEPDGVRRGMAESTSAQLVIMFDGAASVPAGSIVEVRTPSNSQQMHVVVTASAGNQLIVPAEKSFSGAVKVEAYTPFAANSANKFETPTNISTLYFAKASDGSTVPQSSFTTRHDDESAEHKVAVARVFQTPAGGSGQAYANLSGNKVHSGEVVSAPSWSMPTLGYSVRFEGKPPKGLKQGDWYAARPLGTNTLTALKVVGVRIEADNHYVLFCPAPPDAPERTEFFGPMTRRLTPLDYDRNPVPAVSGGVVDLEGLSAAARDLVKPGKKVIVVHERDDVRNGGEATVVTAETIGTTLRVTLQSETDFTGWERGWTSFHLNTVAISHGETKDPKVLGSGDAEKLRQDFRFKVDTVSFIPSTASVSGVAPDMDVAVDGVKWEYRDFGDPTAEGTDSWSVRLNEDDTLQVHFRRRLPTGKNNATVPRHRVGVGLPGTGVPAWSFAAPMKKNRFVTAIVQPMVTAGGSDREPVTAMRENAPANLAANGRAVSLKDFERLTQRHSSVWQAHAREVIAAAAVNLVDIVIVPSGGGAVTTALKNDLITFIRSRALPGISVTISGYQAVPVAIEVTARVDTGRYEKSDVQDALQAALVDAFSLVRRGLGQPLYVAEILAAGERVEGVETVVIDAFARKSGAPQPLREAQMSGALAAIFPREDQVIHVASGADVVVSVEAMS